MISSDYPFEPVLVRNRLGQGIRLSVCSFSITPDHVCVLVALPEDVHPAIFAKNADYFVLQLRERFTRQVKKFTMYQLQSNAEGEEDWYQWQFKWEGNTPLEPKSQLLSSQKREYYQSLIVKYDQASGQR